MNKAILVIDVPNCCSNCPLEYDSCSCIITGSTYNNGTGEWFDSLNGILPDCPLKKLPDKEKYKYEVGTFINYCVKAGWNACIDEILK